MVCVCVCVCVCVRVCVSVFAIVCVFAYVSSILNFSNSLGEQFKLTHTTLRCRSLLRTGFGENVFFHLLPQCSHAGHLMIALLLSNTNNKQHGNGLRNYTLSLENDMNILVRFVFRTNKLI